MPRSTVITDRERAKLYEDWIKDPDNHLSKDQPTKDFFSSATHITPSVYTPNGIPVASSIPHAYATTAEATPQVIHHHHHNSGIPWWAFLLLNRNSGPIYSAPSQEQRREESKNSNFAAFAGILIIAGVVSVPAVGGAFYLLSELWNNLERLYYNEGYLQAGLGIANIVLSLSISAVLTNAVLSSAITALAVSAGFSNPVGWAFLIMGCVTLFTAACIHWAIQEGIYIATAHYNKDALHPEEPGRFTVTDEQVANIKRENKKVMRNLDGDKMQNVITAIHHDMTADPSRMTRLFRYSPFFRDAGTAEKISAIRTLRTAGTVNYTTEIEPVNGPEQTLLFTTEMLKS